MTTTDINGAELYEGDEVIDLPKRQSVRIISFPRPGWVFLASGVTTRGERVEFKP